MDEPPSSSPLSLRNAGRNASPSTPSTQLLPHDDSMDDNGGDEVQIVLREEVARTVAVRGSPVRLTQQLQPTTTSGSPTKEDLQKQIYFLQHQFNVVKSQAAAYTEQVKLEAENTILESTEQFHHCAREYEQETADKWNQQMALEKQKQVQQDYQEKIEVAHLEDCLRHKSDQAAWLQGAVVNTEQQANHQAQEQLHSLQQAGLEMQEQQAQLAVMASQLDTEKSIYQLVAQRQQEIEQTAQHTLQRQAASSSEYIQ